jgi:peptide/nickel transport system permease protein
LVPPLPLLRRIRRLPVSVQIGGVIFVVLALAALFAPILAPYGQNGVDFNSILAGPSGQHLFGTDDVGRDVFSRTLYGLRVDLLVVLLVTYVPLPIGVLAGAAAGYLGGAVDSVISRVADVMIAFPFIVLVITIIAIVGPGLSAFLIGVPLASWALYARLARSEMLVLREQPFMMATTALGYTRRRAIFRHAIPNLLRPCLVYSTVDMVGNLLLLAGLSYLGLGMQPPNAELGTIIAGGQPYLLSAWWVSTLPGLVLVLFGVSVGLIGEGLSDGGLGRESL